MHLVYVHNQQVLSNAQKQLVNNALNHFATGMMNTPSI
jgi:hypothetical protein